MLLPSFALAITDNSPDKIPDTLTGGPTSALNVINIIIDWMFTFLLVLAVIFILIAAFNYLTAAGNEEKISKAHKILIYAVVAIVVAVVAQGIVFAVRALVNPSNADRVINGYR